ncbi:MAG TPA: FAD-dependent monooxygenase [Hyphomicrobium sp.]|nr:FAD-dependent monooxygenase [Hyphomicrobium sp.]
MAASPDSPVLIAGGGIGGLATALALSKSGIPSHVLERRADFSETGAGIQIGPNGARILEAIGAAPWLREQVAAPDMLQVRDALTGARITSMPLGDWIAKRHGAPYWTAHRQDLHAALLQAARASPSITLTTGAMAEAATQTREGVSLRCAECGTALEGKALIAADGLWSTLRARHFDAAPARPAGKNAYRTVVPVSSLPEGLAINDVHIWLTAGAHVVHYPVRAGREHAFVIILDEPHHATGWSTPVEAAFVCARAQRLAPSLRVLLEAGEGWRVWSLYELAMPQTWSQGRMALLGDAAHPVLPFLAQGAVLALEDAIVLARELSRDTGSVSEALTRYEDRRRPRALRVQGASRRNGRIYHLSGALARARDNVLRRSPATLLMRQYDWLYGWKPPA